MLDMGPARASMDRESFQAEIEVLKQEWQQTSGMRKNTDSTRVQLQDADTKLSISSPPEDSYAVFCVLSAFQYGGILSSRTFTAVRY